MCGRHAAVAALSCSHLRPQPASMSIHALPPSPVVMQCPLWEGNGTMVLLDGETLDVLQVGIGPGREWGKGR